MAQVLCYTYLSFFILTQTAAIANVTCTFTRHDDGLHADCSRRQLTSLPSTWPDDVVSLDMSYNQVSSLTQLSHPHLLHLQHLDLRHNRLQKIVNGTFRHSVELKTLVLAENGLERLEGEAMSGLRQLTVLDMAFNKLHLDHDSLPPGVFNPLSSLTQLILHGNSDEFAGDYPENVFSPLTELQHLTIGAFSNLHFGPDFAALRNLRNLYLTCDRVLEMSNASFSGLKNSPIETLELAFAQNLREIEACAFCDLQHLKHLKIYWSKRLKLDSALTALYGLQHRNMTGIEFNVVQTSLSGSTVDQRDTMYLKNICVQSLILKECNIESITSSALTGYDIPFVSCLQHLDLSNNKLQDYNPYLMVSYFPNLITLRRDHQHVFDTAFAACILQHKFEQCRRKQEWDPEEVAVYVSNKIEYANFSWGISGHGNPPSFTNAKRLKTLDLSFTSRVNCGTTMTGLESLETLDLSGNFCFNVSETIFDSCRSLLNLRISYFNMNPDFFRERAWRLFQNLSSLQTLDLSRNSLIHVDPNMLKAQLHLKELNLADNRLQSVAVNLDLHDDLQLLDLTDNALPTLLPSERNTLDGKASKGNFTLRLRGNLLLCACSNLDFVRWLWMTRVQLDGEGAMAGNYTCVTDTGQVSDTHTVMQQMDFHWRRCVGVTMLGIASAAFLLQLLLLVLVYVISHSWTRLRYVWKVMKRLRLPRREHFQYDAYVGYADEDMEFVYTTLPECLEIPHGVRLLLRERGLEELPGSVRAENIVDHINKSWKVLLLVTPAFAHDDWACGFTVHQAQRSIIDTMPDRVIVVFTEDPARMAPMASLNCLLQMVPETNVFHVHRDTPPGHRSWDRLAGAITGHHEDRL